MVVHLVKANGRPSRACIPLLQEILENDRILKVGCGVDEDMMELRRSVAYGLDGRGRFELSGIGSAGRGSQMGLQKLVALVLGRHLPKSKKMSASNWSCVPLLPAQIVYSGYDAWAGVAIAEKLAEVDPDRFSMESVQFRLRTTHQGSLMHAELRKRKRKQARKSLSSLMKHRQRRGINMPATSWRLGVIRKLKTVLWQNRPESHDTYELSLLTSMMEPMYGIINAGNSTC
jgi:ribonuclease D